VKICPCACHKDHYDRFFSCGNCYSANHMPMYAQRAQRLSDKAILETVDRTGENPSF
jgi:hypothetical protein